MDNMQVIGGIKAEIKTEVQDSAVEITLEDIVKNDSAVEMTLKDIIKNDSDSEGDPVDATGAGNGFLQANQFENLIHDLGDEANARHNFKAQGSNKIINNGIGKNNLGLDTGVQKAVNNDKDPEIPETLCLNYGLSDELFSSNKENENQTINTDNDDIPLSRLYSTNEETSIRMDMEKVKVTNQPTSYFWFQGMKCFFRRDDPKYLKQHLTSTHRVEADLKYQCDKCDYKTNENLSLQRHKSQHLKPEEIKVLTCYHCNFTSTIRKSFKGHVQSHFKKNEVTFQCYICDFTTKKRDILMNHIVEKHSKEAVKDMDGVQKNNEETCDIPSSKPGLLRQDPLPHLTTHTGDEADSIHRCDKCDYKTHKSSLFQEHELLHLRREEFQLFICYHCNFTSTSRDTFRHHICMHFTRNEVTFQCYICDFTTMKRDILTVHILETHSKEAVKDMEINNGVQKKNKETEVTEGTTLQDMLENVKAINPPEQQLITALRNEGNRNSKDLSNVLLTRLNREGYYAQGYADDVVILIQETRYCEEVNPKVNAAKTAILPFTKRRTIGNYQNLSIFEKQIITGSEVKYLSLTHVARLT